MSLNEKFSIKEAFERAGFQPRPCSYQELSPAEKAHLEAITNAAKTYVQNIEKAYKASSNSKLVFCQRRVLCSSSKRIPFPKNHRQTQR